MMNKRNLEFKENENNCFVITSHRLKKEGYCYVRYMGREQRAHRVIFQECFGDIPEGLVVRHKCDNPSCINPEHLELGTPKDNAQDRVIRGRGAVGEKNGRSAISEDDARKIKIMLRDGIAARQIPKLLGVSYKSVRGISESNFWSHVEI